MQAILEEALYKASTLHAGTFVHLSRAAKGRNGRAPRGPRPRERVLEPPREPPNRNAKTGNRAKWKRRRTYYRTYTTGGRGCLRLTYTTGMR